MNKEELIEAIAKKRRLPKLVVEIVYQEIFDEIIQAVAKGKTVEISGFGVFEAQKRQIDFVNRFGQTFRTSFSKTVLKIIFLCDSSFEETVQNRGVQDEQ